MAASNKTWRESDDLPQRMERGYPVVLCDVSNGNVIALAQ